MDILSLIFGIVLGVAIGGLVGFLLAQYFGRGQNAREIADLKVQVKTLQESFSGQMQKQTDSTTTELRNLHERLAVIDRAREQIGNLTSTTNRLENMLSNSQARGAFGETQLTDLVKEMFGNNKAAYKLQAQLSNKRRVDCLLNLPNPPGPIGIDSKFSLVAWFALRDAKTDAESTAARKQLETALIQHINDIADRYIIHGETADSALMFVPSEAIFAEIHSNLPRVLDVSFQKRVLVVSPTTMMAILNSVRAVLRDAEMSKNAEFIKKQVGILLKDIGRLGERVGKLKQHFTQAQTDINNIDISADAISRTGEKINTIETSDTPTLDDKG